MTMSLVWKFDDVMTGAAIGNLLMVNAVPMDEQQGHGQELDVAPDHPLVWCY